jgi:hypothetical protein
MALSDQANNSLAGLWGSYDFYLIRDRHFTTASDVVEHFLDRYQPRWKRSNRDIGKEFLAHPKAVRELLTEWAEKKLAVVADSEALQTLQSNIMFKQLLYDDGTINFGSVGTNWKKKVEIAAELAHYKPWSVAHATAALLRIAEYSYEGNSSACCQKAQTKVGRRRIRLSARRACTLNWPKLVGQKLGNSCCFQWDHRYSTGFSSGA